VLHPNLFRLKALTGPSQSAYAHHPKGVIETHKKRRYGPPHVASYRQARPNPSWQAIIGPYLNNS